MNIETLIEFLEDVKKLHGNIEVRAVEPQYRTTPGMCVSGGFVDSEGVVLVVDQDGSYFSTDQADAYDGAQYGEFFTQLD